MTRGTSSRVNYLVVVSDLHCGCRLGLCHPGEVLLDGGGEYKSSALQRVVWEWWMEFWTKWVPSVTHGQPYAALILGDTLDGVHHNSTTQISHDLEDQSEIAYTILRPIAERCKGRFYMVRGTEAHVGPSGVNEEALAKKLGAVPDRHHRRARWEAWLELGQGLIHATHHIGTTGSQAYESTAVLKELVEAYTEAGRWHKRPPDVVARAHRHRNIEVRVPTALGYGIVFTTPAWQLKTPYTYRLAGARQALPQIGGSIICQGDNDLYTRHRVWSPEREEAVRI